MSAYILSYGAGWLITLSPCVLPILPLMLSGAAARDKRAPAFMALGLTLAFATLGTLIAALGSHVGLTQDVLRTAGASLLLIAGSVMLLPTLSGVLAGFLQPLAGTADRLSRRLDNQGPFGHLLTGALLGAVWAPCSGPALVAAVGLAADSGSILEGFFRLFLFGLGASSPLLLIAYGGRRLLTGANRTRAARAKPALALALVLIALLVLTGRDLAVQEWIIGFLPQNWLLFTTRL